MRWEGMTLVIVKGFGLVPMRSVSIMVWKWGDIIIIEGAERVVMNIIALHGNKYRRRVLF